MILTNGPVHVKKEALKSRKKEVSRFLSNPFSSFCASGGTFGLFPVVRGFPIPGLPLMAGALRCRLVPSGDSGLYTPPGDFVSASNPLYPTGNHKDWALAGLHPSRSGI